jgi:hypothetical protein
LPAWLRSQIEAFSGELRVGRFLEGARGEQVVAISLRTEVASDATRSGAQRVDPPDVARGLHLRLVEWPRAPGGGARRPVVVPFSYDCIRRRASAGASPASAAPMCWRSADDRQPEVFRRFQYRPLVYSHKGRHGIRFLVRDKAEHEPATELGPPSAAATSPAATSMPDWSWSQDANLDVVSIGPPEACPPGARWPHDWLGCAADRASSEQTLQESEESGSAAWVKRVSNWQRSVYPVLDVSPPGHDGHFVAAAFLARPPEPPEGQKRKAPRRETFWLAVVDVSSTSSDIGRVHYTDLPDHIVAPNAADWFALPFRAARVGGNGEQGLVFVRTGEKPADRRTPDVRLEDVRLEIMTAWPRIDAAGPGAAATAAAQTPGASGAWTVERFSCPVPPELARHFQVAVRPGEPFGPARDGALASALMTVPFVAVGTGTDRDGLVWIARDIGALNDTPVSGTRRAKLDALELPRTNRAVVNSTKMAYAALLPTADGGWTVAGSPPRVCDRLGTPASFGPAKKGPSPKFW